jgi:type IV pilus assembly protein PilM
MPVDGVSADDVKPVLHAMTENVLLEIQKTFDFFKATAGSEHIDRIYLSGGAAWVDGFMQALEERFNAPVEMFDPFKKIVCDGQQLGVDVQQLASTGAVAVGLALRKAGDR